jgi:nitrite reductase (NADH) small subunit/3-phenylpropionate/trans-cinnamate dioxygenase ferredoxin subunit
MSRYLGPDPGPELERVAGGGNLQPGGMQRIEVDGRDVLLVNLDGEFFAIDNNCPHNGAPLSQGTLRARDGCLVCPWHSWIWDVRDGRAISPPVRFNVSTYLVRVDGADVLVSRTPR